MQVQVTDDSQAGFQGKVGEVVGKTADGDLKVRFKGLSGYYIFRTDEVRIVR